MYFTKLMLFLVFTSVFFGADAQERKVGGVWEFKRSKNVAGSIVNVPMGAFKVYDSNGTFSNVRLTPKGAVLFQQGTYHFGDDQVYKEVLTDQVGQLGAEQSGLKYSFSNNGNTLIIQGEIDLGNGNNKIQLYEEWDRVQIFKPGNSVSNRQI